LQSPAHTAPNRCFTSSGPKLLRLRHVIMKIERPRAAQPAGQLRIEHAGRDFRLTDVAGNVVREIFA
jgi:hypothetical protein